MIETFVAENSGARNVEPGKLEGPWRSDVVFGASEPPDRAVSGPAQIVEQF